MSIALYPGSFDPVTYGHLDIIKRAAQIFDKVVVGVLDNSKKTPLFSTEERVNILKKATSGIDNVEIAGFNGLTVVFADKIGAKAIVRGLRAVTDYEYELQLAQTNRVINPHIDSVFMTTALEYAYLSSTTVKEVALYGGDLSKFVPDFVAEELRKRIPVKVI